ncbi:uncharacterized protein B0J16DRAFT_378250 [Fusarium flagelliforme]|uniref:uncharacterized protein n=1 Tax=Fusarium flagelliforme TaxID=2675880 RepID=UPI001E8E7BC4|nr:uncharacterized protein B0J16DRAFT_378250 [Fusarium flagelliforme]KAH7197807.1 hypothetical protein B0J16DRAFT_378250 [Fusarium flagelliforme]
MSNNAGSNVPTGSNFQVDASKYGSDKTADPETASITTVSSSAPLVKKDEQKQKNETEIDAKKLQEQALKSQIRFCM